MRTFFNLVIALVILAAIAGGVYWYFYIYRASDSAATYRTATVTRGEIMTTITATGTVEPEEQVDVGAQVAGLITSFGTDSAGKTVDYGSIVEKGTVLAKIDDSLYAADVAEAAANLGAAQANVVRAEADLGQLKAKLEEASRNWDRAQQIGPSEALAQNTFDAFKSAYESAKANVAVGEASIVQAKHAIDQNQAALDRAKRNLGYTTIVSPVQGVIIDRRVNAGQTVVASLNAPSLFLIAKDLKRMQVWVSVNEADVGQIHPGQAVSFTVDAFPNDKFVGEVGKVRLNASMSQNVVTYTVEVVTDNSNNKLLPYLTANVEFEVTRHPDVLMVPNSALRWTPTADKVAPDVRQAEDTKATTQPASRPVSSGKAARAGRSEHGHGTIWVRDGEFVRPLRVRTGLSDGINTEISGEQVTEGMEIVLGEQRAQTAAATGTTNPFVPALGRPRAAGGGTRPRP